ncbi:PROF3 protein, partial [Glaucidium brasilianum]|nr:PROF3 protein [Glaucidium brasilianum]
ADINLSDRNTEDVAIVGLSDKSMWAAKPGELLAAISPQEVGLIGGQDPKMFLLTGINIAGKKCSVICDNLLVDDYVMGIRSKGSDSTSICIGKNSKTLTFLMGEKGAHGGALSQKVHDMVVGMKA